MRRTGQTLAVLVVLAFVATLYGCGGSGGPGGEQAAGKPSKPPPGGDGGMTDPAIVFARGHSIYVMRDDGSGLKQLTRGNVLAGDACPAWSPDGTKIVLLRKHDSSPYSCSVMLIDVTGDDTTGYVFSEPRVVRTYDPGDPDTPDWGDQNLAWVGNDTIVCRAAFGGNLGKLLLVDVTQGGATTSLADMGVDLTDTYEHTLSDGTTVTAPRWWYLSQPSVAPLGGGEYLLAYVAIDNCVAHEEGGEGRVTDICVVKVSCAGGIISRADGKDHGPTAVLKRFGPQGTPSLSRDGSRLAFVESEGAYAPPPGFEPVLGLNWVPVNIVPDPEEPGLDSLDDSGLTNLNPDQGHECSWSPTMDRVAWSWNNGTRKGGGLNADIVILPLNGGFTNLTDETKYWEGYPDWRWQ